ncbi:MAG: hypothetical protein GY859_00855, partial [Desulfobacterales bacterium]|nr:hypothetical protein [Desulfobacterales bacterium]
MHRLFVTPPMTTPGLYVIAASAREDFAAGDNKIAGVNIIIGDLVLASRQENNMLEATVFSGADGKPVPGADVALYDLNWRKGHKQIELKKTDERGAVRFLVNKRQNCFLIAKKGADVAMDPNHIFMNPRKSRTKKRATLLFTDRSIYRPLQKIYWKAVVYQGRWDSGRFETRPSTTLTISLKDPNQQVVESITATTNEFGTASGEFTIPSGRLLGHWHVRASLDGAAYIRVEEYKRPTFEVKLLEPGTPLRLNRPAVIKGEARYYFGLPVTDGRVKWRVKRTPEPPPWRFYWGVPPLGSGNRPQTIAAGMVDLGEDGAFELAFTPGADERMDRETTYRYTVAAEVVDEGGETRTATRTFRLGFVAVQASALMEAEFLFENQASTVSMTRTDLDGGPAPGPGEWRVLELKGPEKTRTPAEQPLAPAPGKEDARAYQTPDDVRRPRWNPDYRPERVMRSWNDGAEIARGEIRHDEKGRASITLPAFAPGAFRLRYKTADSYGEIFEMSMEFIVAGAGAGVGAHIPAPALLLVERGSVSVGETARLLVHSGFADQTLVVDVQRGGRLLERRFISAGRENAVIEIPITEKERGGLDVTLTATRDHQFMRLSRSILVPWDNKKLTVEFSAFRDKLRPGAREKWTVKITGPPGEETPPGAVELLAYMYDRSLDAFTAHQPPSPISLYPNLTFSTFSRINLGPARVFRGEARGFDPPPPGPLLRADRLKAFDGYGIGGPGIRKKEIQSLFSMMADSAPPDELSDASMEAAKAPRRMKKAAAPMAALEEADLGALDEEAGEAMAGGAGDEVGEAPVPLRHDFSETAFWKPHLLTGPNGAAAIEFTAPDSVTSWSVWVHAITRDLKSGAVNKEAKSVKDLMVRPYLPRFLREGDRADLKVVVNNASDREIT